MRVRKILVLAERHWKSYLTSQSLGVPSLDQGCQEGGAHELCREAPLTSFSSCPHPASAAVYHVSFLSFLCSTCHNLMWYSLLGYCFVTQDNASSMRTAMSSARFVGASQVLTWEPGRHSEGALKLFVEWMNNVFRQLAQYSQRKTQ